MAWRCVQACREEKPEDHAVLLLYLFAGIGGRLVLVDEVWVEYVELVALDHFGRGVVMIIVRLVVFVPLVARVHAVEVLGLARPVLLIPPIHLHMPAHVRPMV